MMKLNTKPVTTNNPKIINVLWSTGGVKRGVLCVNLPEEYNEPTLIAEICAIRYLLLDEKVFGVRTIDGKGIQLNSSSGAIRKLALGRSAKKEAIPYARFLRMMLTELSYAVKRKNEYVPIGDEPDLNSYDLIVDNELFRMPYDPTDFPALGRVAISNHAVERYEERIDSGNDLNSPLRSLIRRLSHEGLERQPVPSEVMEYKNKRYGPENDIEVWGHGTSDISFLLLNKPDYKVLLTVFNKPRLKTIQEQIKEEMR